MTKCVGMQVAWVRGVDGAILTVGREAFLSDPRVAAFTSGRGGWETWTLRIRGVTLGDAGGYECQVGGGGQLEGVTK